uniref:Uncharacterized protein n=1 Tax=Oryza sativa subsp. japonica TaxID=39947 RepID=Q6ZIT4_ORYSJ|nr:hypothetical protein [Oryza sativa Japonica Group]BAD08972.2 hypothetical protein [Oryza sativa Japonica Group]
MSERPRGIKIQRQHLNEVSKVFGAENANKLKQFLPPGSQKVSAFCLTILTIGWLVAKTIIKNHQ